MIGKVLIDAADGTIHDMWDMAKSCLAMIVIVGVPTIAMVLICVAMCLVFGNNHNIVLRIIANALPFVMLALILVGFYLYVKIPYAKTLAKAEKIAAQDVPVAGRLRVVLDRFHEDCYVNSIEFCRDLNMMNRLIAAHEEGKA